MRPLPTDPNAPPSAAMLRSVGLILLIVSALTFAAFLYKETQHGLTTPTGQAFGSDFVNFWSAARLALLGRIPDIYDLDRFHQFQEAALGGSLDLYHYSYPPSGILLSLPLGLVPYLPAWSGWMLGGWLIWICTAWLAWPGERSLRDAALYALAVPAIFLNNMSGQNGTWMAGILGGGLMLVERRPWLGGAVLGLLAIKPQLGLLVPFALLAGRQWQALGAFLLSSFGLTIASAVILGSEPWMSYASHTGLLRTVILENSSGVWRWMISPFVGLRLLGVPILPAYVVQGAIALLSLTTVVIVWRRRGPAPVRNAVLVLCTLVATPYVHVYDHVVAALVPLWLWPNLRQGSTLPATLLLIAPALGLFVATALGIGIGWVLVLPALALAMAAVRTSAAAGTAPVPDAGYRDPTRR
ncbi:DUF2029 domain-containing protein [Roseomonas sp. JC162]|uniref:DUF2029 domain-containing protein n=1 Tax=Neoroseomonas marina TaxID=1232220 RepID=A0A848ECK0_9PROT|nr:glycosyltransferase family 87 protein [Neoroseomonas marina]NMJ41776.1 DUF2029 domain-containing protein [Neoroseomonas marina]